MVALGGRVLLLMSKVPWPSAAAQTATDSCAQISGANTLSLIKIVLCS